MQFGFNVDLASLPGPPGFLNSSSVQVNSGHITGADIAAWPYSVGIFVKFTSFSYHVRNMSGNCLLAGRNFRVARLTVQPQKLWSVSRPTETLASRLPAFLFSLFCFL